jgi:hypothetical protein
MPTDYRIVKLASGNRQYVRGSTNIMIPKGSDIKEYHILSHDSSITPYFGVVLDPSIAVGPEDATSIFMNIPADTGLFITDGKIYTMIDKIERHAKKFSLYGSASDGMVYRYFKLKYAKSITRSTKNAIPTEVMITNKSKSWQVIKRVVFLGNSFDMFSDGKGTVGEMVQLNISDKEVITTKLGNRPSVKGAKMMPYSITLTKPGIKSDTVEMRYGP